MASRWRWYEAVRGLASRIERSCWIIEQKKPCHNSGLFMRSPAVRNPANQAARLLYPPHPSWDGQSARSDAVILKKGVEQGAVVLARPPRLYRVRVEGLDGDHWTFIGSYHLSSSALLSSGSQPAVWAAPGEADMVAMDFKTCSRTWSGVLNKNQSQRQTRASLCASILTILTLKWFINYISL